MRKDYIRLYWSILGYAFCHGYHRKLCCKCISVGVPVALVCPSVGDADFDRWIKVVSAMVLHRKVHYFFLVT